MRLVKVSAWELTDQELDDVVAECSTTETEFAAELRPPQGVATGASRFAAEGRPWSHLSGPTVSSTDIVDAPCDECGEDGSQRWS
jgi:hypothetical protein